ncbi:MAG: hypothetical protein DSM107014_04825 [Gomphosphaeria aponina SAG 52.96 = DSM 107014]|uniref:Uncharacterized protein n=1 Tax=Gomphosphaeria aponina SAG 52.96 = DSM 107014 TaxID=1521640 RepID=A0A941JLL1_9CHRO|nr:hypothetical protein [Gomphosphaeria aponina SAG 52.96 = DSM 107014]
MNASEQATGLQLASKIAAIVNLFKSEFPDAKADLKPWSNDRETLDLVDPNSIDIGFHFPGWSRRIHCRSILVQIRFHLDPEDCQQRLIGVETTGFNHQGEAWRLSTVENWQCVGKYQVAADAEEKLRSFCRQIFQLFN